MTDALPYDVVGKDNPPIVPLPVPFVIILTTNAIDADILFASLILPLNDELMYCGVFVTLIFCAVLSTIGGNEPVPFVIIFVIVTTDELIDVACVCVAALPVHCTLLVTFILPNVFDCKGGNEPVPFITILIILPIDELIEFASVCVPTEPVICWIPLTITKPLYDAVTAGKVELPLCIIVVTISNLVSIDAVKFAEDVVDVICVPPLIFNGFNIPQFSTFCPNNDLIELTPLATIPSIIPNELLIKFCWIVPPLNDDVTFVNPDTLKFFSSLKTIRGVSNIWFLTILSPIIFAYRIPAVVGALCVVVANDG